MLRIFVGDGCRQLGDLATSFTPFGEPNHLACERCIWKGTGKSCATQVSTIGFDKSCVYQMTIVNMTWFPILWAVPAMYKNICRYDISINYMLDTYIIYLCGSTLLVSLYKGEHQQKQQWKVVLFYQFLRRTPSFVPFDLLCCWCFVITSFQVIRAFSAQHELQNPNNQITTTTGIWSHWPPSSIHICMLRTFLGGDCPFSAGTSRVEPGLLLAHATVIAI